MKLKYTQQLVKILERETVYILSGRSCRPWGDVYVKFQVVLDGTDIMVVNSTVSSSTPQCYFMHVSSSLHISLASHEQVKIEGFFPPPTVLASQWSSLHTTH